MRLVFVLAMILGLSACGNAPAPSAPKLAPSAVPEPFTSVDQPTASFDPLPAGLVAELIGPSHRAPLELDLDAIRPMNAQCIAFHLFAPSVELVVVDARGDGRVILHYAGDDGHEGTCEATVQADGSAMVSPSGNTVWPQDIEVVPLGDHELRAPSGFGSPGSAAQRVSGLEPSARRALASSRSSLTCRANRHRWSPRSTTDGSCSGARFVRGSNGASSASMRPGRRSAPSLAREADRSASLC